MAENDQMALLGQKVVRRSDIAEEAAIKKLGDGATNHDAQSDMPRSTPVKAAPAEVAALALEKRQEDFLRQVQAEGAIGVPAALVSGFALTMLQSDLASSRAEDFPDCAVYQPLRKLQLVVMALAGTASMLAVIMSASVFFAGSKLGSLSTLDLADWFFMGIRDWRIRSRLVELQLRRLGH